VSSGAIKKRSSDTTQDSSPESRTDTPTAKPADDNRRFEELASLDRLRQTWAKIRTESRDHRIRDVVDFLDWSVVIEDNLAQLRTDILTGEYCPLPPARYECAKTCGSYRVMTIPNIRDVLVYRWISDEVLRLAMPSKVRGAFFSRRRDRTPVGDTFTFSDEDYYRFFEIWLRYNEYRSRTLLSRPYTVLVVADITNFFDSISHDILLEYLSPLGLPRRAAGLLGRLLEALKPSIGHSPNPRIGIPVDDFDCSRQLAHVFLFEHDGRMVNEFGEKNYVRWMDDQNIGAESEVEARRVVNHLTRSLSTQRLTLNAGKTLFLNSQETVEHFQLDVNADLNEWEEKYRQTLPGHKTTARKALREIWTEALQSPSVDKGNWDKILKRFYRYAAWTQASFLDDRMLDDLVRYPDLDQRIFESLAQRNLVSTVTQMRPLRNT